MSTLEKKELSVPYEAGTVKCSQEIATAVSSVFVDASIARQMSDMIKAFRISQVVGAIAQLGIPDRLAGGARTAGELKQFPAYLNRWDSQQARNEGVFAH